MKRTIVFFLFVYSIFQGVKAQEVVVKDRLSLATLELVAISSRQPVASAMTDARGRAPIGAFAGSDTIYFTMLGYEPKMLSFKALERKKYVVYLQPSDYDLSEVVVSATRWAQNGRDIPLKISKIRQTEIALQNPQTAADLIGGSGEVFIQKSQQGGGSPMIRGFSTNRLLISVDGVRMNNAIYRSGNLQNIISLDPFAIESAEILFGPGSVIYGSDAIGGVMAFSTLKPVLSKTDEVLVTGKAVSRFSSANGEFSSHLDIGIGGRKWASVSSLSFNRFGDLRMGRHGPDEYLRKEYVRRMDSVDRVITNEDPLVQSPSGYSQLNLMQKFRYQPTDSWNIEYAVYYSETGNYSRYDRLLRYRNGLPRSAEWNYGPQLWMMNKLEVSHEAYNHLFDGMVITMAHQLAEESRIDRDFNKTGRNLKSEKVDAYSFNADFNKRLNEKQVLTYGLEGVWNDVESKGQIENIATGNINADASRYPQSSWASLAAFATFQHRFSEKLLLSVGGRYNQFLLKADFDTTYFPFPYQKAELNQGAFTGSAGLVYHPERSWTIGLNLSTGFRSPNVDDLGKVFDSEPGFVMVPNPDLKAEYAYNIDFGIAKSFGNRARIDVSAFYILLDQALVRRDFTFNGLDSILYAGEMSKVLSIQNAAIAVVYGIQAGAELKLGAGFALYSHLTWQKGEEELDDGSKSPLRHAAPLFGISRLSFNHDRVRMELYANYSAAVTFDKMPQEEITKDYMYAIDKDGNPWSPSWYSLNFKAMYQLNDQFMVSGGIENLTDRRYRPYSSGLVAPGRNLIFALQMKF
ncbi:MAG: TonB-dependent receptor [Bacteroidales bacterium]|nr:TonB-dependent receptor [Bacteroidales bacterium]